MRTSLLVLVPLLLISSLRANAETPFQACNQRFLEGMSCIDNACGSRNVLDLPPSQFCEPRPCDEFLHNNSETAGLEYSWCIEDYEASGGELDSLGQPVPNCRPNPAFPAADTKANEWLACQERVWTTCDGEFVNTYLVDGGFDLMACSKDYRNGVLPPR